MIACYDTICIVAFFVVWRGVEKSPQMTKKAFFQKAIIV